MFSRSLTSFQRFAPRRDFSTISAIWFLRYEPFSRSPAATLSKIDMVGNGFGRWKTMPTVRRTVTGSTPEPYRFSSSSITLPSTRPPGVTSCIRFRVRRSVDLPQPDGPMNAVTERGSTVIEMSSIAMWLP